MFKIDHCLHVWWDLQRVGEDSSLCWGAVANGCLQGLRAPSVAGAEPSVVSPSGAELEVMHQLIGKAQNGRRAGRHGEDGTGEGFWEGLEGEDGGGDTGTGVAGGMVVSIALETRLCLVVMASEVISLLGQPGCHLHP